jgi:hypothetical protein
MELSRKHRKQLDELNDSAYRINFEERNAEIDNK